MIAVVKAAHASTSQLLRYLVGPELATSGEAIIAGGGRRWPVKSYW